MRSKRDTAWETAAKCAMLAKEADDPQEREYYVRMRDAWITLANRCEFIEFPDVTEKAASPSFSRCRPISTMEATTLDSPYFRMAVLTVSTADAGILPRECIL